MYSAQSLTLTIRGQGGHRLSFRQIHHQVFWTHFMQRADIRVKHSMQVGKRLEVMAGIDFQFISMTYLLRNPISFTITQRMGGHSLMRPQ